MRGFPVETIEEMGPPFISQRWESSHESNVPGLPARAHPREGNSERTSSNLHGCVGTTNRVSQFMAEVLGYGMNIQSDWNINAAELKKILSLNPPKITWVS